jgi:hypothetical protein
MQIYKLTPIESGSADWKRSYHKSVAIVRAASEKDARMIACVSFGITKPITPSELTRPGPWRDAKSVRCEVFADSEYPAEGPRTVLSPKGQSTEITFSPL